MKIHNYGNDYVQARKFEKESVKNVENKVDRNEPAISKQAQIKNEAEEEKTQVKKFGKKKVNNSDNV